MGSFEIYEKIIKKKYICPNNQQFQLFHSVHHYKPFYFYSLNKHFKPIAYNQQSSPFTMLYKRSGNAFYLPHHAFHPIPTLTCYRPPVTPVSWFGRTTPARRWADSTKSNSKLSINIPLPTSEKCEIRAPGDVAFTCFYSHSRCKRIANGSRAHLLLVQIYVRNCVCRTRNVRFRLQFQSTHIRTHSRHSRRCFNINFH